MNEINRDNNKQVKLIVLSASNSFLLAEWKVYYIQAKYTVQISCSVAPAVHISVQGIAISMCYKKLI